MGTPFIIFLLIYTFMYNCSSLEYLAASQNELFIYQLHKSEFHSSTMNMPIKFYASIESYPDLPDWLKLEQMVY